MTVLKAGVTSVRDFTHGDFYSWLGHTGEELSGHGRQRGGSTMRIYPLSSTRKKAVPSKAGTTNPLYVAKVLGGIGVRVHDFSLEGTKQGHLYGGLRIDRVRRLEVDEVRICDIPGNSDINPGETFLLNIYRCAGVSVHDVELDGGGIGASGLGLNTCSGGLNVADVTAHDLKFCKGVALWSQDDGGVFTNVQSLNNAFAFGFERCEGLYELRRPKFRGSTRADIHLASDQGRAKIHIIDPDLGDASHITVLLPTKELGSPNRQQQSDITVIVGGKQRPDLLRFVRKA